MIRKFFSKLLLIVILFLTVYSVFSSVKKTGKGFIVVEDVQGKRVSKIVTRAFKGYSFVWEGCFPWWYSVYTLKKNREHFCTVKVTFPGFFELKAERFYFSFPVTLRYVVDPETVSDYDLFKDNAKGMESLIRQYSKAFLLEELAGYLAPVYVRNRLVRDKKKIISIVGDNVSTRLAKAGIHIKSFELTGKAYLPEMNVYREGLSFLDDLRNIDRKNKKDLKVLMNELHLNSMKDKELYKKLAEMSKIIKKNPDILKYIYIDKISGKTKLVNPNIMPHLFDVQRTFKRSGGDIDNLK